MAGPKCYGADQETHRAYGVPSVGIFMWCSFCRIFLCVVAGRDASAFSDPLSETNLIEQQINRMTISQQEKALLAQRSLFGFRLA